MVLPSAVTQCLRMLENAGYRAYAVGGCVRDSLLGLAAHDYDLCTNALPEETARVFADCSLVRSGEKHGTIGVVMESQLIEITTFRTEGGYRDNRHPDWVRFVPSLTDDLARRDFTVNAMAYHPQEGYVDPWGGQADLQAKVLRAVGDPEIRFREDALRILRGVRFAVRFGLIPEKATLDAMILLAPLLENLARERVFEELCKLLPLMTADDLLRYAPILTCAIPELKPCVGFQQHSPHHAYDVFTHIAYVVQNSPDDLCVRWAALFHDIGKPACFTVDETGRGHFLGHAKVSASVADAILHRLKAPTALRQEVCLLIEQHMNPMEPDKRLLRRRLGQYGETTVRRILALQRADFCSKGTERSRSCDPLGPVSDLIDQILAEDACLTVADLAVDGRDLIRLGFAPGPRMGKCLSWLLTQVQEEYLSNDRDGLLAAAKQFYAEETL